MATIHHLSEDLQISIFDKTRFGPSAPMRNLQLCSTVCKLWRRLIWQRLIWPHLVLHLSTTEIGPEQQATNQLFLTWFEPKWEGLQSIIVNPQRYYPAQGTQPKGPVFTADQIAELLPRAVHLKRVGFFSYKVFGVLAKDTVFEWYRNAHELRSIRVWGIDDTLIKYIRHPPPFLESAGFYHSALTKNGLACLHLPKTLKSFTLVSQDSMSAEDLSGLAALPNLESLSIEGAALSELPTWLSKLPALERLNLRSLVGASQHSSSATHRLRVKPLAHLKRISWLEVHHTLPRDIGALRNLEFLDFHTDARTIDLGELQPCGSKLSAVAIRPINSQVNVTVKGLGNLSSLREFICWSPKECYVDVTVELQVGPNNKLENFDVTCEGRLLFTGEKEAIVHFCRKLRHLSVDFCQPVDASDSEADAAFQQLCSAAQENGLEAQMRDSASAGPQQRSTRPGYRKRELVIEKRQAR